MAVISNGTTLIDAGTMSGLGAQVLIKTVALSSAVTSIGFVHGANDVVFDSTYPVYKFVFTNIHPATDDVFFGHQMDVNGGSSYAQTCTNNMWYVRHGEGDSPSGKDIYSSADQAQATAYNKMVQLGNDNDQSGAGELYIFNPSSTTFTKHFMSIMSGAHPSDQNMTIYSGGYYNTTNALDRLQFTMSSGNVDAGTIKLYGIKDS